MLKLLTITEAATTLGVSLDTLRRWEKKGIINPQRTKGGVRRYTLLDLKIAKLNKRKIRFFQLPSLLSKHYSNWKHNFKIITLTSLVWILGIALVHFLKPSFLSPTSPEQQILSEAIKKQINLSLASEQKNNQVNAVKILVLPNESTQGVEKETSEVSLGSDLLIHRYTDTLTLQYTDIPTQYYLLQPLKNDITTVIKRN